jgi:hypothetical protein
MSEIAALSTVQRSPTTGGSPHGEAAAAAVWDWRRPSPEEVAAGQRATVGTMRRQAGFGALVGVAATGVLAWLGHPRMAVVVAVVASAFALLALVSPLGGYRRVRAVLERFGHLVGVALTWVLMGLTYLLLFLPVGLLLRATGKLRLAVRPEPAGGSYWRPATPRPRGVDTYRRQF